jgi:hypothetical protein
MTYKINKTDGSLLAEVIDNEINTSAADIALIGKNVTGFGEYINENFIKLLENFAATSEPNNPVAGQLWFDTSENRLKVYDGNGFRIGSGPIVSGSAPLNPIQGDFWIDSDENQLYFYDGTDRVLAGPIYKDSQGISGFEVANVTDTSGNVKTIVKLWVAAKLLGVFSKHDEFTPVANSLGSDFAGSIKTGFTPGTLAGFKFHARAASADALVDALGNLKTANSFVSTELSGGSTSMYRTLSILNNEPLKLGAGLENTVTVSDSLFQIRSNVTPLSGDAGQEFQIITRDSTGASSYALVIQTEDAIKRVGIFTDSPATTLDVNGSATIRGNLTVEGDTTTITTTQLVVEDRRIELASGNINNSGADRGGITLRASALPQDPNIDYTNDKTFQWLNSTSSWTSNQHIDLSSITKDYKIGGSTVLSYNTLGANIINSSLKTLGTLTSLQVANININDNTISSTSSPPTDIVINPGGIGRVDFGGSVLTNIQTPNNASDPSVAATKAYVDAAVPADWILIPNLSVLPIVGNTYQADVSDRFIVDTITSGQVTITLPQSPTDGALVRFIDARSNFSTSSLIVRRYRTVDTNVSAFEGTSSLTEVDTYDNGGAGLATTSDGAGTGLTVRVTTIVLGDTYTPDNTTIEIIDQGDGYASGEEITVAGADIGGGSDLTFILDMHQILGANLDLEVNDPDAAFGLIFVESANNWKFAETTVLPAEISVDVVGTLTGDIISTNTSTTVLDTSTPVAVFTGNVTGDVNGDLLGTADQADAVSVAVGSDTDSDFSIPYVTATSGYLELKTDPNLQFNPLDNELITHRISAPFGITGPLTGNVTGGALTVSGTSSLTLSSGTNSVLIRSGNSGIRLSSFTNDGEQEQYNIQINPATNDALRPKTLLYGDVEVVNLPDPVASPTSFGSSFKLPTYTNAQLTDRGTLNQLNYGELIYNSDANQVRAFIDDGSGITGTWVTLH